MIEAARARGRACRGVEQDPALVELARRRAAAEGVGDRVRIVHGNAATDGLGGASIVFLFLPPPAIRTLLPRLLRDLPRGAQILTHEQLPLAGDLSPKRSRPLFAANALTVAHLWVTGAGQAAGEIHPG